MKPAVVFRKTITGIYEPDLNGIMDDDYGEQREYNIPASIQNVFADLEAVIVQKREREYWKLCAFYNKMFPSLDGYETEVYGSSYNSIPFTVTDNEEPDQMFGYNTNYLKACIDKIVSRLRSITFDVRIQTATPMLIFEMYKSRIERYYKQKIRQFRLEHLATEIFHDAMILGYSHILQDPFSNKITKYNDYKVGCYESEVNNFDIKRCLIQHNLFPVASLEPYVGDMKPAVLRGIIDGRSAVKLQLYFDCFQKKVFAVIEDQLSCTKPYPFDNVLLTTFGWDIGIENTYTSSMMDLLFPGQRQINKLNAKSTSIYMRYKGPIPVITSLGDEQDIEIKQLNNNSGEIMLIHSPIDASKMVGTLDPVPLDPQLDASTQSIKANMLELSGTQEISFNLESLKSAAAVVALDQMRDANFESQLFRLSECLENVLYNIVKYNSELNPDKDDDIPWDKILGLADASFIEILPVHDNDSEDKPIELPEDFQLYAVDAFILDVVNKKKTFDDIDYSINDQIIRKQAVNKLLRFKALGSNCPELEQLVMRLFIEDVQNGTVDLLTDPSAAENPEPADGQPPTEDAGSQQQGVAPPPEAS